MGLKVEDEFRYERDRYTTDAHEKERKPTKTDDTDSKGTNKVDAKGNR